MATHHRLLSVAFLALLLATTPAVAGVKLSFSFRGHHGFHGHVWHGPLFHGHHPHFGAHGFFGAPSGQHFGPSFGLHHPPNLFHAPFGFHHRFSPRGWRRW
jgi:hypothetical protein